MCTGETYCEKREDILKWLSGKYVMLVYNSINFDSEKFYEESRREESQI